MSNIPPIGPGGGGGFDPEHKKTPEEHRAEAERLREERKKKRIEKRAAETRDKTKEFWTDDDGQEHVNVVS